MDDGNEWLIFKSMAVNSGAGGRGEVGWGNGGWMEDSAT